MQLIQAGLHAKLPPNIKRRVLLINRLCISVSLVCLWLAIICATSQVDVLLIAFFFQNSIAYLAPIAFNHYRKYNVAIMFSIMFTNLIVIVFCVLFGLDSEIQLLFPIVGASVFILFDKNTFQKIALAAFPAILWVLTYLYCSTHSPWLTIEPSVLLFLSYTNKFQLFFWTVLFLYYSNSISETYISDIEAQKKQVFLKNKQLEQFNFIATHELKTPIANIEGFYNLLYTELERPNQEVAELLHGLHRGVLQAKGILIELINVINEMTVIEEADEIHLVSIAEEVKGLFKEVIQEKNATIHTDFQAYPSITFGKRGILHILKNLISNALDYSSPNRSPIIYIKSTVQGDFIVLSVQDNGVGIDPTQQEKLFGLFQKLHHDVENSGVGLFLIKQLVESNGGHIKVQSELTKGSTFSIFLPKIFIL